ncbi:MAG: pyruvate kinase [Parachlamydiales bacterium]|jgi:pyruvate kinase
MIRTKIICTIGPSVASLEKILSLIDAGMNVARLNFSHGTHEQHLHSINMLKEARQTRNVPLAIMLDTKGPEIRIGNIKDDQVQLQKGQLWLLTAENVEGNAEQVHIDPPYILKDLEPGVKVLFDDGYISSVVLSTSSHGVVVQIENNGILRSKKGVNVPNVSLSLPAVTDRDIEDIRFGCENNIDVIAASFVRSAKHVLGVKKILHDFGKSEIFVIAKIENHEGVTNFDSILQVSDGIMIARGDLGVEVPLSQVPKLQKMMIRKCYLAGKVSVTATQMLESMIQNPRPTRAEVSDVANAIYDASSAVMLSGETAIGKYPVETVNMMRGIIEESEKDFDNRAYFNLHSGLVYHDVPSAVSLAAVKTSYSIGAKCIFTFTTRGASARLISRLRPSQPIIAMTTDINTYHKMALFWGVTPAIADRIDSLSDGYSKISALALAENYITYGDLAVVTAGSPFGVEGTTNSIIVENVGNVLVRGHFGHGGKVYGNVAMVLDSDSQPEYGFTDKIVVLTQCNEKYLPFIAGARGIVLQNHIDDLDSELYLVEVAKEMEKPVLVRADDALRILKEGQLVTLDPVRALVFKGVVL